LTSLTLRPSNAPKCRSLSSLSTDKGLSSRSATIAAVLSARKRAGDDQVDRTVRKCARGVVRLQEAKGVERNIGMARKRPSAFQSVWPWRRK
jgi:hypothetical protein